MIPTTRRQWSRFQNFVRTPSLARSMSATLILAFGLLILVNATTFVMIQRTAAVNRTIEHDQQMRRASRTTLISMLNAETAQRGFLLTGRGDFLQPYRIAREEMRPALALLDQAAVADPALRRAVDEIHRLAGLKWAEMDRTISLAAQGRIGQSIQTVRSGEGKRYMDDLRIAIEAFDVLKSGKIADLQKRSERFALLTVAMNAIAGVLVILLALLSAWMVRRYVAEIERARAVLDAANASLEDKVKERTGDLMRANEEIQRFAYIVSHDLRSPLVNVMGFTAELEAAAAELRALVDRVEAEAPALGSEGARLAAREDLPEAIGFIRTSTQKMDRLINAILHLSRQGRRTLAPERIDVAALVAQIGDTLSHRLSAADATLEIAEPLPVVVSDRLALDQVLSNLIENAVKYLRPGVPGRITVSGRRERSRVVYTVADNGRGIDPRDHARVFDLFRRSGAQDQPGEGIGLATVRALVFRLGGSIDVASTLGQGAAFTLSLPLVLAPQEASA